MQLNETYKETFQSGGAYLPLGVWERKGYDVERIKALTKPEDIEEDPVVGTTYRLCGPSGGRVVDVIDCAHIINM